MGAERQQDIHLQVIIWTLFLELCTWYLVLEFPKDHVTSTKNKEQSTKLLELSLCNRLRIRLQNASEGLMAGRRIVVGDVHGCYDELVELLEKIGIGDDDRIICVGDLITKGPKSKEVMQLFMTDARFSTVIGNHDLALRRKWNGEDIELKAAQKEAHKELRGEKDAYASFFNRMPFTIDLDTHLVVHAGLRPNVELYSQTTGDLTQIRTLGADRESEEGTPWYHVYHGEKIVLFGHWPSPEPRRGRKAIGLDTGCVYGYNLTAYIIESDEFVTVKAKRSYDES